MPRIVECPKCGTDISDTYESAEPDVGIMGSGWFCDACDLTVIDEDGPELHDDDVPLFGIGSGSLGNRCQSCGAELECGYGLAGGGMGPYMYCPNEHCKAPTFIKSQDSEMS